MPLKLSYYIKTHLKYEEQMYIMNMNSEEKTDKTGNDRKKHCIIDFLSRSWNENNIHNSPEGEDSPGGFSGGRRPSQVRLRRFLAETGKEALQHGYQRFRQDH